MKRELLRDDKRQGSFAHLAAGFRGEDPIVELSRILKVGNSQARATAARIMADKGDNSGIPVLLEDLKTIPEDQLWFTYWRLEEISGLSLVRQFKTYTPPRADGLKWFEAWWEKNRDRPRLQWLLESAKDGHNWGVNPLFALARKEIEDIEADTSEERDQIRLNRIREWVKKNDFKFDKDNVRVRCKQSPTAPD